MVLLFPLAVWFGIFTLISLLITFSLGIAMGFFKKDVFKYHVTFAFVTIALGLIHAALVYFWIFRGVVI